MSFKGQQRIQTELRAQNKSNLAVNQTKENNFSLIQLQNKWIYYSSEKGKESIDL